MYLNRLTIIGFVGNDVETKFTSSGKTFAQFSVATKTSWKDDKGEWQSNTEWHRVVVWGEKLAAYAQWQLEMYRWDRDVRESLQGLRQRRLALGK